MELAKVRFMGFDFTNIYSDFSGKRIRQYEVYKVDNDYCNEEEIIDYLISISDIVHDRTMKGTFSDLSHDDYDAQNLEDDEGDTVYIIDGKAFVNKDELLDYAIKEYWEGGIIDIEE